MAGDVNLFFNDDEDEHAAELDIMIAEPKSRGKGIGKEATLLILAYGVRKLKVSRAFIGDTLLHGQCTDAAGDEVHR
jgi:RimJ/RimL family protein N-acetyltransferase